MRPIHFLKSSVSSYPLVVIRAASAPPFSIIIPRVDYLPVCHPYGVLQQAVSAESTARRGHLNFSKNAVLKLPSDVFLTLAVAVVHSRRQRRSW
jgi:hypothetical protein